MAKSTILKQLINDDITLQKALSRLMVIAADIHDNVLSSWAEKEMIGYTSIGELPSYRISVSGNILYSGINGHFQVQNMPLPIGFINPKDLETISKNYFMESVSVLENYLQSNTIEKDLTALAGQVYQNSGGIQCTRIYMSIPIGVIINTLSQIKTKLIKIFIKLDQTFGSLDDLDIQTEGKDIDLIKKEIYFIIYQDNSVTIGDMNKIVSSEFNTKEN